MVQWWMESPSKSPLGPKVIMEPKAALGPTRRYLSARTLKPELYLDAQFVFSSCGQAVPTAWKMHKCLRFEHHPDVCSSGCIRMAFKLMQAINNALNLGLQFCEVSGLVIIYKRAKPNLATGQSPESQFLAVSLWWQARSQCLNMVTWELSTSEICWRAKKYPKTFWSNWSPCLLVTKWPNFTQTNHWPSSPSCHTKQI